MAHGGLSAILQRADFEVIPMKGTIDAVAVLPAGSTVSVTASPAKGMPATIALALQLQEAGFRAVPHISARLVESRKDLASIIKKLDGAGVTQAFVTGGDGEPRGDYFDAGSLLRDLADLGHPFLELGITGYPEGHPQISDDVLRQALVDKQRFATYVVTQMCFSASTILDWVAGTRADGVDLPVKVGIPGAVQPARLLTMSAKIGVGDSMRYLAKNRGVFRLLRPGRYRPDRLLRSLAPAAETHGLSGVHLFTFNQVAATAEWHRKALGRPG
jgi:methylenetetrahydrofolate reductase (NADPH)